MSNRRVKPKHSGIFASNPCLSLICGASGSGKTYLLFHTLLQEPKLLDYDNIYIYTSTPEQSAYQFLLHGFRNKLKKTAIRSIFEEYENNDDIDMSIADFCDAFQGDENMQNRDSNVTVHLSSKTLPLPENLDKRKKNLVIFDDCVNQKDQSLQKEYFTRGRHTNCTVFYLTQRYYDIPKIIRDNSNVMILFKQPHRSLTLLFNELDASNSDRLKFLAKDSWSNKYAYIAINTAIDVNNVTRRRRRIITFLLL